MTMTTPEDTTVRAPTVTVAVLYVRISNGQKAIAAVRNVPESEVDECVGILRRHGDETGFNVGAFTTSTGRIEIRDKSLLETDLFQLVDEVGRPNLQLVATSEQGAV
jgi:hypothetical protein